MTILLLFLKKRGIAKTKKSIIKIVKKCSPEKILKVDSVRIINSSNNLYYLKDTTNKLFAAIKDYPKYKSLSELKKAKVTPANLQNFVSE